MNKLPQSIQRRDFSPPRAGRNFAYGAENAEILIDQRDLAIAVVASHDGSRRNIPETGHIDTGNIRGICSRTVRRQLLHLSSSGYYREALRPVIRNLIARIDGER